MPGAAELVPAQVVHQDDDDVGPGRRFSAGSPLATDDERGGQEYTEPDHADAHPSRDLYRNR